MREQKRYALLRDNASSHSNDATAYSHIEVVLLAPNLTAWIQSMDPGLIRTFKANYRQRLSQHALNLDAQGVANPCHIGQLDGMRLARHA